MDCTMTRNKMTSLQNCLYWHHLLSLASVHANYLLLKPNDSARSYGACNDLSVTLCPTMMPGDVCGDVVENALLMHVFGSMTDTAVGQWWCVEASIFMSEPLFTTFRASWLPSDTETWSCSLSSSQLCKLWNKGAYFWTTTPLLNALGRYWLHAASAESLHRLALPFPGFCTDWEPLGHPWSTSSEEPPPADVDQFFHFLQQEWLAIPQQTMRTLVQSMRQKCV